MNVPAYLNLAIIGNRRHPVLPQAAARLPEFFGALANSATAAGGELRLTLFTGLADGADVLAAEALLDWTTAQQVACRMVAVLPFEPQDYLHTISDQTLHQALVEKASQRVILDGRYLPKAADPEANAASGLCRSRAYRQQARYLLESADALLAMADESQEGSAGGTLETVDAAVEKGLPVLFLSLHDLRFRTLTAASGLHHPKSSAPELEDLSGFAQHLIGTMVAGF